jgi:hypothetical protein
MTSRLRRRARWKACSEPSNGNLGFASSTPALKPNCSLKCAADHGLVADVFFRRRQDHHETGLLRRRPGTLSNRVPPCAVVCKFCAVAPSARGLCVPGKQVSFRCPAQGIRVRGNNKDAETSPAAGTNLRAAKARLANRTLPV